MSTAVKIEVKSSCNPESYPLELSFLIPVKGLMLNFMKKCICKK